MPSLLSLPLSVVNAMVGASALVSNVNLISVESEFCPAIIPPMIAPPPIIHGKSELLPDTTGNKASNPVISLNKGTPPFQSNHKNPHSLSSKTRSDTCLSSYSTKKFSIMMVSPFFNFKIKLLPSFTNSCTSSSCRLRWIIDASFRTNWLFSGTNLLNVSLFTTIIFDIYLDLKDIIKLNKIWVIINYFKHILSNFHQLIHSLMFLRNHLLNPIYILNSAQVSTGVKQSF